MESISCPFIYDLKISARCYGELILNHENINESDLLLFKTTQLRNLLVVS